VGGSAGDTAIGVAPGAQWIAAKIFDSNDNAPSSVIIDALGWLLDPDGDPGTDDAPDIVNGSWGLEGALGLCIEDFRAAVQNLKAAGIAVVFAAGNTGPAASSSISPGNYGESFAVGSVGTSQSPTTVSDFSARGPSACDGTVYPEIVAPGFHVRTADITAGGLFPQSYTIESGTSFAAPHAAGVMALLLDAFPGTSVSDLELALEQSAVDLGTSGPDNSYGYGMINAAAAFDFLAAEPNIEVTDSSDPQTDGILDFGHVPPGETAVGTIQVRNAGSADLVLGSIDGTGISDPFSLTGDDCSNATLIPGQSCTLGPRFAPTVLGTFSGGLDIPSNDPDQPLVTVELTGIGNTPPVAPQLSSPADGAVTGSTVTFSWVPASDADGDGVSQTLVYAPHADFTAAQTFPVDPVAPLGLGAGALLLAALATNRRRRLLLVILAGALLMGMVACGGGGDGAAEPSPDTQSTTLTGFTSGVKYYWKMRAEDSRGAVTESAVRSFTVQ
jgi:hypothetical protein